MRRRKIAPISFYCRRGADIALHRTCELSRKRKLRELYNVNALLTATHPPQLQADLVISSEPSENERRFLESNDITKGLRFSEASLPYPFQSSPLPSTLPFQPSPKSVFSPLPKQKPSPIAPPQASLEEQLRAASASPSVTQPFRPPAQQGASGLTERPGLSTNSPSDVPKHSVVDEPALPFIDISGTVSASASPASGAQEKGSVALPEGPSADPKLVVPPSAEDEAALPDVALEQAKPKPAQVVHLPPQEVQEARLKETKKRLEKAREQERKDEERSHIPVTNPTADVTSSPSSTVGPFSQATPHPTHQSPDTSPDRESFVDRTETAVSADVAAQKAREEKEEHERRLQLEMQMAREEARGDVSPTPEIERQLEEEQAIRLARDGRSRLSESQPFAVPHSLTEHVEEMVGDVAQAKLSSDTKEDGVPPASAPSADTSTIIPPEVQLPQDDKTTNNSIEDGLKRIPAVGDHPTPPADTDVEMHDAPDTTKMSTTQVEQESKPQTEQMPIIDVASEQRESTAIPTPGSSNPSAPSASPERATRPKQKQKQVSTVVFAKQDPQKSLRELQIHNADYASLQGACDDPNRDYLQGLFNFQAHHPPRSVPLYDLVDKAQKTLTTAGFIATLRENSDYKILKRVYQLQNANRWSLRQLRKSAEPPRPTSHIDHLLKEMKWMQTDFKEERKWKRSLAATFATWCAKFVNSSPEERASLRVRAKAPARRHSSNADDETMIDAPTPDLVHSGANETESESFADDDEFAAMRLPSTPADMFTLGYDDVVMKMHRTPASDSMLMELPMYRPNLETSKDVTPASFCDPPILPVSKFITGKLVSKVQGPPRPRSRYKYDFEDEPHVPPSRAGTSAELSRPSTPGRILYHRNDLPPESTEVALFHPENKHVRDRLHAAHHFKPPNEFNMPPVSFFENRASSQWLWEEDQKLRTLVKEFTFNWSLVAQELSLPSQFVPGWARRTPWECFERWVQMEGLPGDMGKTSYFRTYTGRLEQAKRTVLAQHQAQQQLLQQQAQAGQTISAQALRRSSNHPVRVPRRRDCRHLSLIDTMKKLAKKREQQAHKTAESQKAAALRKAHEPAAPKQNATTPQELSRLKWEAEEKKRLQLVQHNNNMRLTRTQQALAQRQMQQQLQGQPGMPNASLAGPRVNANISTPVQMAASLGQQAPSTGNANLTPRHPGQQAMQANFPNTNLSTMPMSTPGVPQAQMQTTPQSMGMANNARMAPPDVRLAAMQRSQYPVANQHQMQMSQQQQLNMVNSMSNMNMGAGTPGNANMMANMAAPSVNGSLGTTVNGTPNTAGSPRMNQMGSHLQGPARPLSSGHIPSFPQIQNQLKQQHPDWNDQQLHKAATENLQRLIMRQRTVSSAMSAAAGSSTGVTSSPQIGNNMYLPTNGLSNSPSPGSVHAYQTQLMRQQQEMLKQRQQQQQSGSPGLNARPMSRSATPHNPQQLGMQSPGAVPQPHT
ncbi:hypothetical protein M011DRAFT_512153 [Sporormia fimetaria CBS 119925]|uniref:Vacuolar import and degradation protein 21 n=1 Tax=Sporormia fimetaria CBS 119925 TaxID=1340428 RepID=A0A6A6VHG1_9PLEO|nr:hypothetical protein M011DRAFT_512153 [Sporormia fimetaria CBS 119925]